MMMHRRTKKVIILEDIINKITSGQIKPGSFFPAAKELAKNYGISSRTAGTIIYELSRQNYLKTSPGRRSQVLADNITAKCPEFQKPVGIISPSMEMLQISQWREWMFQHIQSRLAADGCHFVWIPEIFDEEDVSSNYSGFIVAGELLSNSRWEILQRTGLPCVRLSFFRPLPNTVYIDFRPALDKIALYLALQKCSSIVLLASCDRESTYAFSWFGEIGFIKALQAYNVDEKGFHRLVIGQNEQENIKKLRAIVSPIQGKIAFLACNPIYNPLVDGLMKSEHKCLGTDYELVALSYAPNGITSGRHVDLKCSEIIDRVLDILYMHKKSGEPQPGQIIYAEFVNNLL